MGHRIVIAGAGIVGLATAYELVRRGARVTVLEKENRVAAHQTGRNSGVIHSGLYYAPGSLKAKLGQAGAESMVRFARAFGVPVEVTGKLVLATRPDQIDALHELHRRGQANGVPCRLVTRAEAKAFEPEVSCVEALRVESTGIVDYRAVCEALVAEIRDRGGEVRVGVEVTGLKALADGLRVSTTDGFVPAHRFVNCTGLFADRVARMGGVDPKVRIVPFRGEYFELAEHQTHLVRGLIYPVPDATLPFLGVHLTRMVDGSVHAGPNAVLALAREGYDRRQVKVKDLLGSATWPGLWRLGARYWRTGLDEAARSRSPKKFLESLRELVPTLSDDALVPSPAGVRAQALRADGTLVQDFLFAHGPRQLHVLNAPSPAATAALEIGRHIADELALDS